MHRERKTRARGALIAGVAMLALVGVGCGDDGGETGQGGATAGATTSQASAAQGSSSGGGTSGSTSGPGTPTSGPGTVVASTGPGGSEPAACDPAVPEGSFYDRIAVDYTTLERVRLCDYRGQVVLAVNIAAL